MKKRPSKKKLEEFEEDIEDIQTKKELVQEDNAFQRQLKKLKSLIKPKKVHPEKAIKSSHKEARKERGKR